MKIFLQRELFLLWKNRGDAWRPLWFLLMMATLYPLAIDHDPVFLHKIGAAVAAIGVLLANLLALPLIYEEDFSDGSLAELLLIADSPLEIIYAKILAHWLFIGWPLSTGAWLVATQYHYVQSDAWSMAAAVGLFTLLLAALGNTAAAFTIGTRHSSLPALLYLPLAMPALIFMGQIIGARSLSAWQLLAATTLFMVFFLPLAARFALESLYE